MKFTILKKLLSNQNLCSVLIIMCISLFTSRVLFNSISLKTFSSASMAWWAKGKSHDDLIKQLQQFGIIKSKSVANAMLKVDRGDFANYEPYVDSPQPIGHGATISAPHMHAEALERLVDKLQPGMSALDVGSGSGYLTACMAYMVGKEGKVIGIEHIKELVDLSIENISKHHSELFKSKELQILHGDGRKGYPDGGPYDCIHVGAAAQPDVPKVLCEQLKPGGILVIPVEVDYDDQVFRKYTKSKDGKINYEDIVAVRYVPLTDEQKQRKNKF
jgi:protein-L-isoaspartate(D-aspartate) O-methyltransferase